METKIRILGEDQPLYTSSLTQMGWVYGPTPHSAGHFPDGTLSITFPYDKPLYVYELTDMLFFKSGPSEISGKLVAFWLPATKDEPGWRCIPFVVR